MEELIDLCFAGIRLSAGCTEGLRMEDIPAVYRDFRCGPAEDCERIDIIAHLGAPPGWNPRHLERLFDTEQSWCLFRKEMEYFIVIRGAGPAGDLEPACIATFREGISEVAVFWNRKYSGEKCESLSVVGNPFYYPLDRLLMMFILSQREGLLVHASGARLGGKGFVFPGRSGAGKSTLSRRLALLKDTLVLSDERIFFRKTDDAFKMFGTPWPGDAEIAVNGSAPLSSIFFIGHGTTDQIQPLSPREALIRLLPVSTVPWYDPEKMTNVVSFCEELVQTVPSYELRFTLEGSIMDILDKFASSL